VVAAALHPAVQSDGLADEPLVVFFADLVLNSQQFIVPSLLDLFRHIVGQQFGGLGTSPLAVFEDEAVFKAALLEQSDRGLKLFVRLPAEADDEVAGDRRAIAEHAFDSLHHFEVVFDRVATLHPLEHGI
jgi:hypothetical protein